MEKLHFFACSRQSPTPQHNRLCPIKAWDVKYRSRFVWEIHVLHLPSISLLPIKLGTRPYVLISKRQFMDHGTRNSVTDSRTFLGPWFPTSSVRTTLALGQLNRVSSACYLFQSAHTDEFEGPFRSHGIRWSSWCADSGECGSRSINARKSAPQLDRDSDKWLYSQPFLGRFFRLGFFLSTGIPTS